MNQTTTPMSATNTAPCPLDIIHRAQSVLAKYLTPYSGVNEASCVVQLLKILDAPEAAAMTAHLRRPLQREVAVLFIDFLQSQALKKAAEAPAQAANNPAVWEQAENAAATIHRLREELDRRRQHETHLIQARDELILKLVAVENKLEAIKAALS
mgnify:CR=1 FL=1